MSSRLQKVLMTSTALLSLGIAPAAAGPDGPNVVAGKATVTGPGTSTVVVNQSTSKAIINWNTFNIGSGETTTFNQPTSSSVTLNRVTGNLGPSQIYGTLSANGIVFVINPDGVLVGPGGVINTAGFLASTNDIKNSDFMAGKYNFTIPGNPNASIINQGSITATSGGFAALVAPGVRNEGTITATLGTVALASGNTFTLDLYGDKLIQLSPTDEIASKVIDVSTGKPLSSLISNTGKLSANGGRVELTAAAARAVVDSVINNTGVIEANAVGVGNGKIVLGGIPTSGPQSGKIVITAANGKNKPAGAPKQTIKLSGTLSAAGKGAGEKGGTIVVSGEDIQVANARIDASGQAGGGKVMLGGDWGGGNPDKSFVNNPSAVLESYPIANATTLSVDAATTIDVSAKTNGNGGKVVLWSDAQTTFAGTIFARGGDQSGSGGFVEVSSKGQLNFTGGVDTRAPNGTAGTLLLDPADYYIVTTLGGSPEGASEMTNVALQGLLGTTNVTIATDNTVNPDGQHGDIFVNAGVNWGSGHSLTLSAYHDIVFSSNGSLNSSGGGDIFLRADSSGTGIGEGSSRGTVTFLGDGAQVSATNGGSVSIFYNPDSYDGPTTYTENVSVSGGGKLTAYMLVSNFTDLQNINVNLSGTYALGKDINADNMAPIGSVSDPFNGTLDGQNHSITNLIIAPTDYNTNSIGLFAAIGFNGSVSNLNLTDASITANPNYSGPGQFVGILAGINAGTISNVTVSGTVNGIPVDDKGPVNLQGVIAGGLVGQNGIFAVNESGLLLFQTAGTIINSSANVTVTVGNGCINDCSTGGLNIAGGLVGSNAAGSTISGSSATGTVSGGEASAVGGLVGQNGVTIPHGDDPPLISAGFITNSFANVVTSISGLFSFAGGLVGMNGQDSTITNSQALGSVTSTADGNGENSFTSVGGLVGQNAGTITSTSSNEAVAALATCSSGIAASCASGLVSVGTHGAGGGLVGFNMGTIDKAFATGAVTGASGGDEGEHSQTNIGGLVGTNQGTIKYAHASGSVGDPDATNINAGGLVADNSGLIQNSFATGRVQAGNYSSAGGLVGDNTINDCCFQNQGTGADNTATILDSYATGNVSVGANSVAGGLAAVSAGTINRTHATGSVTGTNDSILGGLVGVVQADEVQGPGIVTNSYATGAVTGTGTNNWLGGLVGLNAGTIGSVLDDPGSVYATGNVTGTSDSYIGGLVGLNIGLIENAKTTADQTVTGSGYSNSVGGLVGMNAGTIDLSQSAATVSGGGSNAVGGLVGSNVTLTDIPEDYAAVAAAFPVGTIANSSASGNVSGGLGSTVGGLVGNNGGSISGSTASGDVSGTGANAIGGLVGWNGAPMTDGLTIPGVLVMCDQSSCGVLTGAGVSTGPGTITNSSASGKVAGHAYVDEEISAATANVGGLVGYNPGTITGSFATGNVSNESVTVTFPFGDGPPVTFVDGGSVGGLVGANAGSIIGSHATGTVTAGDSANVGGLAGLNLSIIDASYATGTVSGGLNSFVGGLVGVGGHAEDDSGEIISINTITNSYATGNVSSTGGLSLVGGFIGLSEGSITGSHATGNVTAGPGSLAFAGGFAGFNGGSITLSYATGTVQVGDNGIAGGFAGANVGTINQTYAKGAVTGGNNSYVGGFAGINAAGTSDGTEYPGSISQSYALGSATGGNAAVAAAFAALNLGSINQVYGVGLVTVGAGGTTGGLIGRNTGSVPDLNGSTLTTPAQGTTTDSYWDRQTTGQETSAGGTAVDSSVLAGSVPAGWSSEIWAHGSYPHLVALGPQNTEPGPPVLPPLGTDTPPGTPDVPSQLQFVQSTTTTTNNPPPTTELLNTQITQPPTNPQGGPQDQSGAQGQGGPVPGGPINNPVQLNVGAGRFFFLPPETETRLVADEVVVQLPCDTSRQTVDAALSQIQMTVLGSQCLGTSNVAIYRLRTASNQTVTDAIRTLANYRIFAAGQANYVYALNQDPASATTTMEGDSGQYVLEKLRLPDIHRKLKATNVPIAVIDSEIDSAHPDLQGVIIKEYDATGAPEQPHAHGTGMAGAIASHRRLVGIAPGARILAIRAFSMKASTAESTTFNILKGLDYAVQNNVRIVNMSFAGPRDPSIERALKAAYDKGVILIAAAGNAGPKSPPLFPAADKHVIAVTATDIDDKLFAGANRGNYISIAAPGVDILVPAPNGTYQMTTGTSVATAHVSGIVALMLERNPRLTPDEVRRILMMSAKRLGPNDQFGAGLIDPAKALALAAPRSAEAPRR